MTKIQPSSADDDEKIIKANIQKGFQRIFSGKGQPLSNLSIQEVEALKARVNELETQLTEQKLTNPKSSLEFSEEAVLQSLTVNPDNDSHMNTVIPVDVLERQKQIALWISVTLIGITLAFFGFALYALLILQGGKPDSSDLYLIPFTILMVILTLIGYNLIRRDRLTLGSWILYLTDVILLPVLMVLFLEGMYALSSGYIATLGLLFIAFVMPSASRGKAISTAVGAVLVIVVIEIWHPGFRVTNNHLETLIPFLIGLASLSVLAYLVWQPFTGSIRTKLILAITITALLAILSLGYFAYVRANQIQTILGSELQTAVEDNVEARLTDTLSTEIGNTNTLLENVTEHIVSGADYASQLFQQQAILEQGEYWNAEDRLTTMSGGQQDNSNSEKASVFIPKGIPLTDNLKTELNTLSYLDLIGPSTLLTNTEMVALYYINPQGVTIYYPNIDLANLVPADFDVTSQVFYQAGTPENNPDRKNVWTPPYQDPAGTGLIITNVSPIYDQDGKFRGVLDADVQLAKITEHISNIQIGTTGYAFLMDTAGHVIAMSPRGYHDLGITQEDVPVNESPKQSLLDVGPEPLRSIFGKMTQGASALDRVEIHGEERYIAYGQLPATGYSIGLLVPVVEMNEAVIQTQNRVEGETRATLQYGSLLLIAVLLGSVLVSTGLSRVITSPLEKLTQAAQQISAGDLNQKITVRSHDEVGLLGTTFNNMTIQLRELIGSLEQRVQERTHDLELASEVGRTVAAKVTDLSEMLTEAAEIIRSRFHLYYTQIYLIDPLGGKIILRAGTGEVGQELLKRNHSLAINSGSLNGRAVIEKQTQIVPDTKQNPTFLPNALLPDTRSEMSVPLIVSEKVVGVLDMQSEQPGALSEINLPAFEALAGQLAIAIQNAALFAEAQEARSEVEAQIRRFTEQGWQDFLDAIHQGHRIGFEFDESKVIRLKSEVLLESADGNSLQMPINVAGAKIGEIYLPAKSEQILSASDLELIQTTGAQLAQHVQNLRLLAQAERYRAEAEQAIRRLTHEGWENFVQAYGEHEPGYWYDLIEVKPLSEKDNDPPDQAMKHPMIVGDQVIGELAVEIPGQSQEVAEVLASVAAQLSGHIENLRLSELNERRAQREQALRQLTSSLRSSNNPMTIMRTAVRELGSIMGRKTVVQLANPQRADKTDSLVDNENISDTPAHQS